MSVPARIVIVEDHTLVRQSLARVVSSDPSFRVVGEAGDREEAFAVITAARPDIVILDIGLRDASGLDIAATLRGDGLAVRIIFLTMHEDAATVSRAIGLGADAYLLKDASTEEMLQALRAVAGGGSYLSPAIARQVMRRAGPRGGDLTERELEILRLLAEGSRPAEIAQRLYLAVKTVRNHLASIYTKLGVGTATQAVGEGFRRGLIARADQARSPVPYN